MPNTLAEQFGNIDIYLFDQLLRGNITPGMRVLDAGCGGGRNVVYQLQNNFDVYATDAAPEAISEVRGMARRYAPQLPAQNFRTELIEHMSFEDASFDAVISNSVLHFARDEAHFSGMVHEMWRVLRPGGLLFARLASTIGMEGRFLQLDGRIHQLLDGSTRFLVDAALLEQMTIQLNATLVDPIKTTVVHEQRCMTTWVLTKS